MCALLQTRADYTALRGSSYLSALIAESVRMVNGYPRRYIREQVVQFGVSGYFVDASVWPGHSVLSVLQWPWWLILLALWISLGWMTPGGSESDGFAEQQDGAAPGMGFCGEDEEAAGGAGLSVVSAFSGRVRRSRSAMGGMRLS